jgi:hypothetical protein
MVAELRRRFPTFRLSTSDAARLALEEGLVVLEEARVQPRGFGRLPVPQGEPEEKVSRASPGRKRGGRTIGTSTRSESTAAGVRGVRAFVVPGLLHSLRAVQARHERLQQPLPEARSHQVLDQIL